MTLGISSQPPLPKTPGATLAENTKMSGDLFHSFSITGIIKILKLLKIQKTKEKPPYFTS